MSLGLALGLVLTQEFSSGRRTGLKTNPDVLATLVVHNIAGKKNRRFSRIATRGRGRRCIFIAEESRHAGGKKKAEGKENLPTHLRTEDEISRDSFVYGLWASKLKKWYLPLAT